MVVNFKLGIRHFMTVQALKTNRSLMIKVLKQIITVARLMKKILCYSLCL